MSAEVDATAEEPQVRMSLADHLQELRTRLLRFTLSVLVLGVVSLVFARPIFGLLMTPVLDALPPDARSLIYTSGIEEINVLMKVGLYAGIFLGMPVLLWQLWGFVSPGLYPSEKKYAGPFVVLGTLAFIGGAAFCYFVVLPQMFKFLLNEGNSAELESRLDRARLYEAEALRSLRFGDLERASTQARLGQEGIAGDVKPSLVPLPQGAEGPSQQVELQARLDGLGRLMDATHEAFGPGARPVLRGVMDARARALEAWGKQDWAAAGKATDEAASALAAVSATHAAVFGDLWRLERDLATGKSRHQAMAWTRPMLSMKEQLSLVLLLLLAFGVIFELPLVISLLALLGVVRASFLFKYQRHAFVVCLILAAVITPTGDAVNLALMCVPMFLCYELGVLSAWLIEKRRARQAATTALSTPGG
jgi:sec-independent protein translocase protein TatC